jgi:hypothetical protein
MSSHVCRVMCASDRIRRLFLWPSADIVANSWQSCNRRVPLIRVMILSNIRQDDEGRRRNTLYKTGIEYVVNKQDVVEYTKTIRKYCGIVGLADRIDGRGNRNTRTRVINPLQDPGRGDVKHGGKNTRTKSRGRHDYEKRG